MLPISLGMIVDTSTVTRTKIAQNEDRAEHQRAQEALKNSKRNLINEQPLSLGTECGQKL